MHDFRGKTALVTGASSGIGKAFAQALAVRGASLVLVARSEDKLRSLAAELTQKHSATVDVVPADLGRPEAASHVAAAVKSLGRPIDLLINNAGVLMYGPLEKNDSAGEANMIQVNVAALVALTHEFLPGMLERRSGGIINVSSTASFQPTPYMTTYAATKAFVSAFSVALWEECRGRNVTVLALCPGMTSTQLFDGTETPMQALGSVRTPEQVVATALAGLAGRRSIIVDGWKNYFLSLGPRLIPRWFAAQVAANLLRPKSDGQAK